MTLYLIRHGETDYNYKGLLQGVTEISLNENGRNQALKLRDYFKDKAVDVCFSSPLARAQETAKIAFPDKKIIINNLITERNLGIFEGKSYKEYHFHDFWDYEANNTYGGVESVRSLLDRSEKFLTFLKENYKDKSVAIVSHGAFLKALHYCITDYSDDLKSLSIKNAEVKEYKI